MANQDEKPARDRLYTWEEISWMTGLSIQELLELFGQDSKKGTSYEALPPAIDSETLDDLANHRPGYASRFVN